MTLPVLVLIVRNETLVTSHAYYVVVMLWLCCVDVVTCSCLSAQVAVRIATATGSTGLVYVSTNPKISQQQVGTFFNLANVQLVS
jgi:hypothetical protein